MVQCQAQAKDFSLLQKHPDSLLGPPASYAMGNGILLLGVKCLGCKADSSPPSNAELNGWSHTSTPPYAFIPKAAYF